MEDFLEKEIEHLQELASDPTLESCCRRDLEDALKIARVKAQLAPQDRSQARQRLADQVLAPLARGQEENEKPGTRNDEDESDVSDELEALRALRLEELQKEARARSALQSQGHGILSTISQTRIFKLIENESSLEQKYLIIHFPIEGDEQGQVVDQRLDILARQFLGTRFMRCPVPPTSSLPQRFGLPPGMPGLVSLYQGTILASSSIFDLQCDEEDEADDVVENWLEKRKFLRVSTSVEEGSGGGDGRGAAFRASAADSEEDEDEWRKPCEECGRTYPHQHIRSLYRTTTASEDDDDNDD